MRRFGVCRGGRRRGWRGAKDEGRGYRLCGRKTDYPEEEGEGMIHCPHLLPADLSLSLAGVVVCLLGVV